MLCQSDLQGYKAGHLLRQHTWAYVRETGMVFEIAVSNKCYDTQVNRDRWGQGASSDLAAWEISRFGLP